MPNLMLQATPLPNIRGRIRYASSPQKQENLLATFDGAADLLEGKYWKTLAKECRTAYEQFGDKSKKCCEGRELMLLLSNSLLDRMSPDEIVKTIAEEIKEKLGLNCFVALHYNKTKKSLHAHIIFGERELLQEPVIKIAERNLFYNAEGKRCYKKSEITDENKQLLPGCKIIKKGEVYEQRYFSSVDTKYHEKSWLADVKTNVFLVLRNGKLKGDIEITEYDASTGKLPQQPIGKKVDPETAAAIEANNENVKRFNQFVDEKVISQDAALKMQKAYKKLRRKNDYLRRVVQRAEEVKCELNKTKTGAKELGALMGEAERVKDGVSPGKVKEIYRCAEMCAGNLSFEDLQYNLKDKFPTKSEKQLIWNEYVKVKKEFWELRNAEYERLQAKLDNLYDKLQRRKQLEYKLSRSHSLIGLTVLLLMVTFDNHQKSIREDIQALKAEKAELFKFTAQFKAQAENAKEELKNYGQKIGAYSDKVIKMTKTVDELIQNAQKGSNLNDMDKDRINIPEGR